jgi:hypothetical protein
MSDAEWPPLLYQAWKDTYATVHMWSQVIGKIALAAGPPLNHSWGSALQITARGLATRPLFHESRTFTFEFDFMAHRLMLEISDGTVRHLPLEPIAVADFYRHVMDLLAECGLATRIWTMPVEIDHPIRFTEDTIHHHYDREAIGRLWTVLQSCTRVMTRRECSFVGKCSPVHFFWGSFDLAVTRFSGRPAPPREGPAFMQEAYSHEVISHGFWPGNETLPEPVFYSYAVPEPAGFKAAAVEPVAAYYHQQMGEFLLPYEAVRTAADPAQTLSRFLETTYEAGATLGGWDRPALER